jgi:hypothetical protein
VTRLLRDRAAVSAFALEGELLGSGTGDGGTSGDGAAAAGDDTCATEHTVSHGGWEWAALDPLQTEEEAAAIAHAEVAAEVAEEEAAARRQRAATWLPKADTLRARILSMMAEKGHRSREAIVRAATCGEVKSKQVVDMLNKEKRTKVPLWVVSSPEEPVTYELTTEARLACGLATAEEEAAAAAADGATGAGGASGSAGMLDGPRQSPPPPPAGWVWPFEGEVIEVEVQLEEDADPVWVGAVVRAVLIDGWFMADIASGEEPWADWFTWQGAAHAHTHASGYTTCASSTAVLCCAMLVCGPWLPPRRSANVHLAAPRAAEEGKDWRRKAQIKPPPKGWVWPVEGEEIEVEVRVREDDEPVWLSAVVFSVLVDGWFAARIELPDNSDQWEDCSHAVGSNPTTRKSGVEPVLRSIRRAWTGFTWEEEGEDWRRIEPAPAAKGKRSKPRKDSLDKKPTASGPVPSAEVVEPEPAAVEEEDDDEDEEVDDDGRPLPAAGDYIRLRGNLGKYCVSATGSAVQPDFQLVSHRTGKLRFQELTERRPDGTFNKKRSLGLEWSLAAPPRGVETGAADTSTRRKRQSHSSAQAPRSREPSSAASSSKRPRAAEAAPASAPPAAPPAAPPPTTDGPRQSPPPPPAGWVWPFEGEVIEVEVEVDEEAGPVWAGATVSAVLIDGWFMADIVMPDGSDRWSDWFTWQGATPQSHTHAQHLRTLPLPLPTNTQPPSPSLSPSPPPLTQATTDAHHHERQAPTPPPSPYRRSADMRFAAPRAAEENVDWRRQGKQRAKASKSKAPAPATASAKNASRSSAPAPATASAAPVAAQADSAAAADKKRKRAEEPKDEPAAKAAAKAGATAEAHEEAAPAAKQAAKRRKKDAAQEEEEAGAAAGADEPAPAPQPPSAKAAGVKAAKAAAALSARAAQARAAAVPMVEAGTVAAGMIVEVVQSEEGLVGSKYAAVVLEVRASKRDTRALVEYDSLYDDEAADEGGDDGSAADGAQDDAAGGDEGERSMANARRLREWMPVEALRPPPPPTAAGWARQLSAGAEAAVLYDGGWWDVVVCSRLVGNVKQGTPTRFVVEAVGYGIRRTVETDELRPRAA